jgi:hypothetical protein
MPRCSPTRRPVDHDDGFAENAPMTLTDAIVVEPDGDGAIVAT